MRNKHIIHNGPIAEHKLTDSSFPTIWASTEFTIGTIMAVVAVLLIHMDKKAVTDIKPSINLWEVCIKYTRK